MSTNQQQQRVTKKSEQCSLSSSSQVNKDVNKSIQELQTSINNLKHKLFRYESLVDDVTKIKSIIEDEDSGVVKSLKYVSEQSECNYDEIHSIRSENAQLRGEVDLLRAMIIKMDRKMGHLEHEVTDLRSRSMRDNILIHNFAYTPGENLSESIPQLIHEVLGVHVSFVRIHRNSVKGMMNSRPVSITAKLVDRSKKDEILQAQKAKKLQRVKLPFFITSQDPPVVLEERKRLYAISDSLREQKIKSKVERGRLILPNGEYYRDPVPKIETADALQITPDAIDALQLPTHSTQPTKLKGSEILATGVKVSSVEEVQDLYRKVCVDPYSAAADHRILVYRFVDSAGKTHESFWDDGEHGAGRRLLQYMKTNQINNVGVVITRWSGPRHLGPDRWRIMEEHLCEVANTLDG